MRTLVLFGLILISFPLTAQERPIFMNGGFLNPETLEPAFEARYSDARFRPGTQLIAVNKRDGWILIDYQGNEIEESWNNVLHSFNDGVTIASPGGLAAYRNHVFSDTGELLFKMTTRELFPFENGFASFESNEVRGVFGLVDKTGKEILPAEYDRRIRSVSIDRQSYHIVSKDGKVGIIDSEGRTIVPFDYTRIVYYKDDMFIMGVLDSKNPTSTSLWGQPIQNHDYQLRNLANQVLIDAIFDEIEFESGFEEFDWILVNFKGKDNWSLIDLTGKELLTHDNTRVLPVSNSLVSIGKMDNAGVFRYAISDLNGNLKTQHNIAHRTSTSMGMIGICVAENGRIGCGYMDENAQLKIPLQYTGSVQAFQEDGRAIVSNTLTQSNNYTLDLKGVIDLEGNVILPPIFGKLEKVSDRYYRANLPNNAHVFLVDAATGDPIDDSYVYMYSDYAKYYVSTQDYERAIGYFRKLYSTSFDDEDHYWYGVSFSKTGNYQGGNNQYTEAISRTANPELRAVAMLDRADNYFAMNLIDQAKTSYEQVLTERNNDPRIRLRYAGMLEQAKLEPEAIAQYQEILVTNPNVPEIYESMGRAQLIINQVDDSITSFDEAISLKPNSTNGYNYRGQAYMIKGEPEKAIPDFLKAIELHSSNELTNSHIRLADAYEAVGNIPKACALWEQLAPYDENSKAKVDALCSD